MHNNRRLTALTSVLKSLMSPRGVAAALLLALPSMAGAQTEFNVTLRFADGQDSISGALTNFENNRFYINASIGLVAIPADGVVCIGDACPQSTRLKLENARIVLTAKDGSASMAGDLIEIHRNEYVLATAIGVQRVPVDLVDCDGALCRKSAPAAPAAPRDATVVLTSGGNRLEGKLLGVEDGAYILETNTLGEIRVSSADFECEGAVCP